MHYPGFLSLLSISYPSTLFSSIKFGNKVGEGQFWGKTVPTYVYPECTKSSKVLWYCKIWGIWEISKLPREDLYNVWEPLPHSLCNPISQSFSYFHVQMKHLKSFCKLLLCVLHLLSLHPLLFGNFQVYKVTMSDLHDKTTVINYSELFLSIRDIITL